jgi:hypothetical protein
VPGRRQGRARRTSVRPRLTTRWTDNPRLLPFWLRGDEADLPALAGLDPDSLAAFTRDCADRNMAEERRLAYVAVTRAAYWLACTGYWWGAGKSPLGSSPFLQEVAASCEAGAGEVAEWADQPEEGAENPALAEPLTAPRRLAAPDMSRPRAGDLVLSAEESSSWNLAERNQAPDGPHRATAIRVEAGWPARIALGGSGVGG